MESPPARRQIAGIAGTFLAQFLYGGAFTSLSLIIPAMAGEFSRGLPELASLYFLQFGGYCVAVAFMMLWSHRMLLGASLGVGVVLLMTGALSSWAAPTVNLMRLTVTVLGLGMGFINMSGLALLNAASSRFGSVMVNYSRAVVSTGSFLAPVTIAALFRLDMSWRLFYLIVTGFGVVALALALPLILSPAGKRVVAEKRDVKSSLNDRGFWIMLISILVYIGAEVAVWSWGASYMTARFQVSLERAQEIVGIFFGAFVLGRFLLPAVFIKFGLVRSLRVVIICSLVLSIPTMLTGNWWIFTKLYPALGFLIAPIVPAFLGVASQRFGQSAGFSLASLTLGIGLSAAVFPSILGAVTAWISITTSVTWGVIGLLTLLNGILLFWDTGSDAQLASEVE